MDGGDGGGEIAAEYRRQLQQLCTLTDVRSSHEVDSGTQVFWKGHYQAGSPKCPAHPRIRRQRHPKVAIVVRVRAEELFHLQAVLMQATSSLALSD